ncbi:UPF0301 protein [Marmoricola endophyticus]|uniref:UPF0301 protein n=1 Tax=Marmoricola endophyticus TaxID=2040280 RepID=A0A917BSH4_9ACTN|nr:YqgE/AlgH family protein [Marmoricola endophyticus]GGF57296.1 UPF0301 protein [Marmoricola endophyticus]
MEPIDLGAASLEPLAGRLLVASPSLVDPNFARTVVLLLDVDDDGVLGVVVNRAGHLPVADVLEPWADVVVAPPVLLPGGPVGTDSALAIATLRTGVGEPLGWRRLYDDVGLLDLDSPRELVTPALDRVRVFAGYAGWSLGQLEDELAEGAWYVLEGDPGDAFALDPATVRATVLRRQPEPLSWLASYPEDPTQN